MTHPQQSTPEAPAPDAAADESIQALALVEDRTEVSRTLFDRIAPRYDITTRVLSFGMDEGWRRRLVSNLPARNDMSILDVATGTGDLAFALARSPKVKNVVGVDLSEQMLSIARDKSGAKGRASNVAFETGDAMDLGYDNAFDAVTISFGIRNVISPVDSLRSMKKALKPGGRVLVLEFGQINALMRPFYDFYRKRVLPRIGAFLTKEREAYRYLDVTIAEFPSGDAFLALMRDAGLVDVKCIGLAFGGVRLYVGDAP